MAAMKITVKASNGQPYEIVTSKTVVTVGRSTKCELSVPDEALSRQHCLIEFIGDTFFITDLSSANGVFLDGEKIPANTRTRFTTFLQISLASLDCHVEMLDPPEITPNALKNFKTSDATSPTRQISLIGTEKNLRANKVFKPKKLSNGVFIAGLVFICVVVTLVYQLVNSDKVKTELPQDNP